MTEPTGPAKAGHYVHGPAEAGHYVLDEWWRRFTERAEWRLTEHFFRAMFDFGFLNELAADSFKRALIASVGGFVAFGFLLTRVVHGQVRHAVEHRHARTLPAGAPWRRHDDHRPADAARRVRHAAREPRAVSRRARLSASLARCPSAVSSCSARSWAPLLMFTGLFTTAAHVSLVPLMLLTSLNPWGESNVILRLAAWAIASVTASAFAILTIAAVVGILVLALSRSRLQALSTIMRSIVLGLLVVCLPLVSHLPTLGAPLSRGEAWMVLVPPAWFLGFQRVMQGSADPGLVRLGARRDRGRRRGRRRRRGVTYIVLFRQFERLMLRPAPTSPPWWRMNRLPLRSRTAPALQRRFQIHHRHAWPQPAAPGRTGRSVGVRCRPRHDHPDVVDPADDVRGRSCPSC